MVTEAQKKAQAKYDKDNTVQIMLKLNRTNDADIIAKLGDSDNKQGYIKNLVRSDLRGDSNILSMDSIRYLLLPTVKKYEIKSLSLFGSYARNEATPDSDIDLLIDGGNYHGLIEYMTMIKSMESVLGKSVDVITVSSLKQNNSVSDELFKKNIERDKVLLL